MRIIAISVVLSHLTELIHTHLNLILVTNQCIVKYLIPHTTDTGSLTHTAITKR